MYSIKKALYPILITMFALNAYALNAVSNGKWISLGTPSFIHQGTDGRLYLNGTNQGQCSGVKPTYFRVDMSKPHFKEFYSLLLTLSAQKKSLDCIVDSGCGSNQVWVSYCRGKL